ncbi:MAG: molybdopterin synthase catalytic subunit MoaE [Burkholderiaceae bacterium]|nr:MAG: molybdopterin synthase catalytic subunit MoaE [Burkholderiaceae bacterium]
MPVRVQCEDFDLSREIAALRAGNPQIGAVASFVGIARDMNEGSSVQTLTLEHYPGMTEKVLDDLIVQAKQRWDIFDALIIHRIGTLQPQDQIVLVAVTSRHREAALTACSFIMDFLKTRAPFWKKEHTATGERWVAARQSDTQAADAWGTTKKVAD